MTRPSPLPRLVLSAAAAVALGAALPAPLGAQERGGQDPGALLEPLGESWPTYSGD